MENLQPHLAHTHLLYLTASGALQIVTVSSYDINTFKYTMYLVQLVYYNTTQLFSNYLVC